jgi:hypothetical protein
MWLLLCLLNKAFVKIISEMMERLASLVLPASCRQSLLVDGAL